MKGWTEDIYQKTWNFACNAHNGQLLPGTKLPYINHIGNVAMEVMSAILHGNIENPDLAIQCALLHDVIEDTDYTYMDIEKRFGVEVARGVQALSKDETICDKRERMADSLERILKEPKEVWLVKLADRITNLQKPPNHWTLEKMSKYRDEAILILEYLCEGNEYLAGRLELKVEEYEHFIREFKNN